MPTSTAHPSVCISRLDAAIVIQAVHILAGTLYEGMSGRFARPLRDALYA